MTRERKRRLYECPWCKYQWFSRVVGGPAECPKCHRYLKTGTNTSAAPKEVPA